MLGLAPILGFFSVCWLATADTNFTAEDNKIIWSTPAWSPTATVCSPEGQAHFAFQNNVSISYEFTGKSLPSVYIHGGKNAEMYTKAQPYTWQFCALMLLARTLSLSVPPLE